MTEHEKNDLGELKYIDDDSVEELSHDYPMLGRKAKKRILEQCLAKTAETDFDENGITVLGTEVYRRPIWTKIAGTAAAAAAALVLIAGSLYLKSTFDPPVKDPLSGGNITNAQDVTDSSTEDNTNEEEYTENVTAEPFTEADDGNGYNSVYTAQTTVYETYVTTSSTEITDTAVSDPVETDNAGEAGTEAASETTAVITQEYLAGSWYATGYNEDRTFEFYSDISGGKYTGSISGIGLPFEYELKGSSIIFHFSSSETEPVSAVIERESDDKLLIHWDNGRSESLERITDTDSINANR